jgi:thymidylate kinase
MRGAMTDGQTADANSLQQLSGYLICLSGIDGTGKTTLAMKLKSELDSLGVRCNYVWFRNARLLSLPFLALCYLTGFAELTTINGKRAGIYYFYKSKPVARVWLWISAIDLLVVSLWKIALPLRRGNTVVADRYVIDALVDLMSDTGITNLNSYAFKLMLRLLDRSLVAVLMVDEEESLRRKDDSISLAYLRERRKLYLSVARELHIPVLDAKPSIEVVWSNLINVLHRQIAQPARDQS